MKTGYLSSSNPSSRAMANLSVSPFDHKRFTLNRINVPFYSTKGEPQRGKGLAREIMQQVLADADKEGITLELFIVPSDGLGYRQLAQWYKRLGFKPDPNFKHLWMRTPK